MGHDTERGNVITFPLHRRTTLEETFAGFPAWNSEDRPQGPSATRRERGVTLAFSDVRGWSSIAARVGVAEAERLLTAMVDQAVAAFGTLGAAEITVGGDPTLPVIGARFEGPDHALRAVSAATLARERVARAQMPALPGHRLHVCTGINSGSFVEAELREGTKVSFQSVGTMRMFASRLQEFAGPGQIFVSNETRTALGADIRVRSIGQVRTNPDGETQEAFCLTELVSATGPVPASMREALAGHSAP